MCRVSKSFLRFAQLELFAIREVSADNDETATASIVIVVLLLSLLSLGSLCYRNCFVADIPIATATATATSAAQSRSLVDI
jgi:hypothetical protein